jgi:hypothetical protein
MYGMKNIVEVYPMLRSSEEEGPADMEKPLLVRDLSTSAGPPSNRILSCSDGLRSNVTDQTFDVWAKQL